MLRNGLVRIVFYVAPAELEYSWIIRSTTMPSLRDYTLIDFDGNNAHFQSSDRGVMFLVTHQCRCSSPRGATYYRFWSLCVRWVINLTDSLEISARLNIFSGRRSCWGIVKSARNLVEKLIPEDVTPKRSYSGSKRCRIKAFRHDVLRRTTFRPSF